MNDRGRLRISTKIRDVDRTALKDIVIGPSTATGQADLENLGLARVFDTPKPVELIQLLLASGHAYRSFETAEELEAMRRSQLAAKLHRRAAAGAVGARERRPVSRG